MSWRGLVQAVAWIWYHASRTPSSYILPGEESSGCSGVLLPPARPMTYIFDPSILHAATRNVLDLGTPQAIFSAVAEELATRYPGHVRYDHKWLFNNAGGAMGALSLLHGSLSEYVLFFGTPIGTERHSGRYLTE